MSQSTPSLLPAFSFAPLPAQGRSTFAKTLAFLPPLLMAGSFGARAAEPVQPKDKNNDDTNGAAVSLPELEVKAAKQNELSSPKFTAPLLDTPQTITVISREVFEQQGATTLRDVLRNTPGITFQAGEGGTANGDQMTIRGFSAANDILLDGVRDAGTYTRDAFNLEQVEVAKGPSSTNTGRGATGASVNLVSKTPKLDTFHTGTIGVGNADYRRATIDLNQDLSANSPIPGAAFRINGLWQESSVPGRDIVENKQWAVAPSLAFGLGTASRLTLSYFHAEQDNIPDYGIPWVPTTFTDPSVGQPGDKPNVDQSNWYGLVDRDYEKVINDTATVNFEHDFTPDVKLSNLTRVGITDRDSVITAPRFVDTTGVATTDIRRSDWKSRDQVDKIYANLTNLSIDQETGPLLHHISTGIELSRETSDNHDRDYPGGTLFPDTDVFNPNPYDPFNAPLIRNGDVASTTADSIGLYLLDTVELSEKWQVNGGVRWDRFDIDYTAFNGTNYQKVDEVFSYKGGLVFKPRPNGSIYVGFGTSFTPSGNGLTISGRALGPGGSIPAPEEARSTEIGTKWDLFQGRLSLSGALFRTDKINAQTTDPLTGDVYTSGDQRVQGVELGASGFITRHWNVFAGYAYQHSEVLDSLNATEIGSALARTPEHSFNFWTTYAFPFGLTLGGGGQYSSEVDRSTTTQNQVVPSYWIYNAMASYEVNEQLTFRLNVNNLLDEEYVDRVGGGHYIPGATRSITLTAIFNF